MIASAFLCLTAMGALPPARELDVSQLRKALDTLRSGRPGEPAFDAAAAHLPQLIESGSGWFVAGGAYLSGRHCREECVPALLVALQRENQRPPDGADTTKRAVLDGLLELEASVPVALLAQRLEASSLPETFLLLVRSPEPAADGLLALFDAAAVEASARWAAACALVAARDARIAARLLAGMDWELDWIVRDAGSSRGIGSGGEGGAWSSSHEFWPPRVTYELLLPQDGAPLSPIRHARTESTRSGRLPSRVSAEQRAAWKVRLIDDLLGDVEERGSLQRFEDLVLDWSDSEAYARALREHCSSLRNQLGRVAVRLETLGLLQRAEEIGASIAIRVKLHDLRSSASAPLPAPPELPGVIYERR